MKHPVCVICCTSKYGKVTSYYYDPTYDMGNIVTWAGNNGQFTSYTSSHYGAPKTNLTDKFSSAQMLSLFSFGNYAGQQSHTEIQIGDKEM